MWLNIRAIALAQLCLAALALATSTFALVTDKEALDCQTLRLAACVVKVSSLWAAMASALWAIVSAALMLRGQSSTFAAALDLQVLLVPVSVLVFICNGWGALTSVARSRRHVLLGAIFQAIACLCAAGWWYGRKYLPAGSGANEDGIGTFGRTINPKKSATLPRGWRFMGCLHGFNSAGFGSIRTNGHTLSPIVSDDSLPSDSGTEGHSAEERGQGASLSSRDFERRARRRGGISGERGRGSRQMSVWEINKELGSHGSDSAPDNAV